jgi:hypothetical protein
MLRSTKELMGYKLAATDGPIGKVKDFLFDEAQWTVRWMVADTGDWLPKRKVLISPVSAGEPDWNSRLFPVRMTKQEIESAPGLGLDEPVSREYETRFFDQYGWPYYWGGAGVWGAAVAPASLFTRQEKADRVGNTPEGGTHVLRSTDEVMGYHIQALDGEIGHVEDFVIDDAPWTLRYMVVDTRNWLPGRKVLVAPDWIDAIQWADRQVAVGLTREVVKGSPEYHPSAPVNREYEARIYDYYGRPVYWQR